LVLFIVVLFAVLWPAVFGVRPRRGIVAVALLGASGVQLFVEGYRWQLIPLYAIAIGLAIGDVFFLSRELKWSNRVVRGLFGSLGVGLSVLTAVVLPVPTMPIPSGPEAIGTVRFDLVDGMREEIYGPSPGSSRRMVVQAFYPAVVDPDDEPTLWSTDWDVLAPAMSKLLGMPDWFLDHTEYTVSHSYPDARKVTGTFPVIIYSHGWTGSRDIAVHQIETLVSNGYMVLSIDHTYGAVATVFDNGEVVEYDPMALPDIEDVGEEAYNDAAQVLIETFAGDIVHLIDALEAGEEGPMASLSDFVDFTRLGIYGHSTGGGAAVKVCLEDERCDAVLGFDPWVEPLPDSVLRITPNRPALYMRSDGWRGTPNDAILRGLADRNDEITYWLGVEGADHNDFTSAPLMSPMAGTFGFKGPIPPGRIIPIIDNYLLGFFDVFLLGTGSASLDTVGFEEVSVEVLDS